MSLINILVMHFMSMLHYLMLFFSLIFTDLRKFYKKAHITQVAGRPGHFEINLDTKKLKTPIGNVFQVPGEPLALAVAAEWNFQQEKIQKNTMQIVRTDSANSEYLFRHLLIWK